MTNSRSNSRFNKPKDERTRNWTIVVYEDSAPKNWRDIVRNLHVEAYISPLHDKDVRADGTPKKPHYHVILCFKGKKSIGQVQEISNKLSGVKVLWEECAVNDLQGMVRYLVHFDDPDKAQYDVATIEPINGADVVSCFANSATDVDSIVGEMMDWCDEQGCFSFYRLAKYARNEKPEWFRVLSTKRTVFITQWLRSMKWEIDNGTL